MVDRGLLYVGVGASAGGLEALKSFVATLDPQCFATYLVTQHLSPTHSSMMVELLGRETGLDVREAENDKVPRPGTIYITPPNNNLEVRNGRMSLSQPEAASIPKPSINRFFQSLAADQSSNAVGVILSGTGSDGATGLLAIKSSGGVTIAQDPSTCKYDGMPLAAIQTDAVDLILPPEQMSQVIDSLSSLELREPGLDLHTEDSDYNKIIAIASKESGVDLSHYKTATIERRIRRRMSIHQLSNLREYLTLLGDSPEEVKEFVKDVFINVTEFFRDKEAFQELGGAIASLLEHNEDGHDLRVWVPGCATGEEAYSIAILIEECLRKRGDDHDYQIFATDISTKATAFARNALYQEDVLHPLGEALKERYFKQETNGFRVHKRIRDHIVFSTHNLIKDPPFSKLDLISCRNVLIYFNNVLQQQVFETFHYALVENGLLMLGMSESAAQHKRLFNDYNKAARIYARVSGPSELRLTTSAQTTSQHAPELPRASSDYRRPEPIESVLNRILVNHYAPPAIVINNDNDVVYMAGDARRYVQMRDGATTVNLLDLVNEEIRAGLRALVYKARRTQAEKLTGDKQRLTLGGETETVVIAVQPFDANRPGWLLVTLEPNKNPVRIVNDEQAVESGNGSSPSSEVVQELERELASTRESLQTVIEELETTNEELQSSNEELQSSNEEAQATNEELQTTNEELQSTNEELVTVNDELQNKTMELEAINTDFENVQNSLNIPMLIVDEELRVRRFSPALDRLAPTQRIREGDLISGLLWRHKIDDLADTVSDSILRQVRTRRDLDLEGHRYSLVVSPNRDKREGDSGAVLAFINVDDILGV